MRRGVAGLLVIVAAVSGCSRQPAPSPEKRDNETSAPRPTDWARQIGRSVTVEGAPGNAKLGAVLQGDDWSIWIDGLDEWPSDLLQQCEGRRLRVSGTVIMREDLPAFVQRPGEPPSAGIAVSSEGELNAARRRFLLAGARWAVVE
jgi:hypothetical protein